VLDYKGNGGESGIRTHVTLSSKHAFQACAFSHSAISPARNLIHEATNSRRCHASKTQQSLPATSILILWASPKNRKQGDVLGSVLPRM
jgi:hypothetical protein